MSLKLCAGHSLRRACARNALSLPPSLAAAHAPLRLRLRRSYTLSGVLSPGSSLLHFTPGTPWRLATHRERHPLHRVSRPPPRRPKPLPHSQQEGGGGSSGGRGGFDSYPPNVIFYGIMALNGTVFLLWAVAKVETEHKNFKLWHWMLNNFTNSYTNLSSGRIWTVVTSCFSHESLSHLFFNGFTYYYFAQPLLFALGNTRFLCLYLGAGVAAGLLSMYYNTRIKGKASFASHGASAAIYALLSYVACVAPKARVMLYGIIPLPIWVLVTGIFAFDGYSTAKDMRGGTDTIGHLGGLLAGMGYYFARRTGILL